VTWDGSKGGVLENKKKKETGKLEFFLKFVCFFLKRKIGRVGGICGRKPQTLF
jgi:hypothetical protein